LVTRHNDVLARHRRWGVVILLVLASGEFAARGAWRGFASANDFNDFLSPYVQARAWVAGHDPYSPRSLVEFWPNEAPNVDSVRQQAADGSLLINRGIPTAYTPPCLVLISPFTVFPWPMASQLWTLVNLSLVLLWVALLIPADWCWDETRSLGFMAFALALAPFHTGLATANPVIAAAALGGIAACLAQRHHYALTGSLLAASTVLKPQIGLCFLAFFMIRKNWKAASLAVAAAAGLTAVALLHMQAGHTPWVGNYVADNHALVSGGVLTDFTARNPTRWGLINLQVLSYALLGDRLTANESSWLIFGVMGSVWLFLAIQRRSQNDADPLLDLSAMVVVSLLPIYHRFYDAVVLFIPLAWIFRHWKQLPRMTRIVAAAALMAFLMPGGTLLEVFQAEQRISPAVSGSWWWTTLVMPHQIWALLALSLTLLHAMAGRRSNVTARTPGVERHPTSAVDPSLEAVT
jgi:Glycosyltransferase family 87